MQIRVLGLTCSQIEFSSKEWNCLFIFSLLLSLLSIWFSTVVHVRWEVQFWGFPTDLDMLVISLCC